MQRCTPDVEIYLPRFLPAIVQSLLQAIPAPCVAALAMIRCSLYIRLSAPQRHTGDAGVRNTFFNVAAHPDSELDSLELKCTNS